MRKVTVIGSAAAITLVAALPASAILPTDTIINPGGGAYEIIADDEQGGGDDGGGAGSGDRGGGGSTPTVTPASRPAPAAPSRPLTAEEKRRIAAGSDACGGATAVLGTTPSVCQADTGGPQIVQAGQPARPRVTVAQVRQRAVDQIKLTKPEIGASPCLADAANCTGTVGVPVWLWVGDGDGALPSDSAEATAGSYTIRATAKVSEVKWSLGDGQSTVCSGTGTAFNADEHGWSAPDCGFKTGWKNAGTYTLTASYVWDISWSGDQTGSTTQTMTSTQQINVREIQTVVSGHED